MIHLLSLFNALIYLVHFFRFSTPSPSCYTYPGMVYRQNGSGQYMAIQGGVNGCLYNVRQVMRMLVSLLGQRLEFNKPNRDAYVYINTAIATSRSYNRDISNFRNRLVCYFVRSFD